jgi:hypothetical protein
MMETPLNLSLNQGQQFIKFQNKIKKSILKHQNIKEGFETQHQNIINSTIVSNNFTNNINNNSNEEKKIIQKINKMEQKYNHLLKQYNQELQNIKNKIYLNNETDISSNIQIVAKDDQLILNNITTQLTILGNDIATTMETLYNNNNEIYKQMNLNSEQFKKNIQMYKDINIRLENINKEGMQTMSPRDLNGLVNDSNIYVVYENYNYVLWGILAITTLTVTMKLLK